MTAVIEQKVQSASNAGNQQGKNVRKSYQFKATTALRRLHVEITQVSYFPITKIPAVAQTNRASMSYLIVARCLSGDDER